MQAEDSVSRELSRLDYNLARIHGEMIHFDIVDIDETSGRFKCVATFADDFQHASLRTRAQVANAQRCMQAKANKEARRFTALPKQDVSVQQPFTVDRSHMMREAPAHLTTPNMNQISLADYARATPQRNRLLNGKLFTPQLLGTIHPGAIPDAMR